MLSNDDLYEGFPKEKVEAWNAEAAERWCDTYRESNRRVRSWSKEQLAEVRAVGERITGDMASLMDRGPSDPRVQELAAAFYRHLHHFYDPTPEMFAGLGRLYVEHADFRARYEAIRPGLAEFLRDTMAVCAEGLKRGR